MKIVFLDMDGPVITTPHFMINSMCSMHRTVMSTNAIGWLNALCRDADAKLVTNSMHNFHDSPNGDLRSDLIRHGLHAPFIHDVWRTSFPGTQKLSGTTLSRMAAIEEWLETHGPADWVAFDDEFFTSDPRLVHIKNSDGILSEHYEKAMAILDVSKPGIIRVMSR